MIKGKIYIGKKASAVTESSIRFIGHLFFIFIVFFSVSLVFSKTFTVTVDSVDAEALLYSQVIERCFSEQKGNRVYYGIISPAKFNEDNLEECFFLGDHKLNRNIVTFRAEISCEHCNPELIPAPVYFNKTSFDYREKVHRSYREAFDSPVAYAKVAKNAVLMEEDAMLYIEFYFPKPER
ncbi:MAG TPA: hypothetical protein ENN46_00920 [Candidatus Woesearchaeota archaeon]|nr:hypothetical protein [Candidatus Woesearchaeota archaeon]